MTQNERLDYLVRRFAEDSGRYRGIEITESTEEKRRLLRSLMNVRMPAPLPAEVLQVQDDYLQERAREVGIVDPADILACPGDPRIALWQGDITRLACGAIVNAANSQMLGCFVPMHTCIDNCIHTFAGVQLRMACDTQMKKLRAKYGQDYEQPTAVPMLTDGYNLPAGHVIHIVGPIAGGRVSKELDEDLAACYRNTLDLCAEQALKTVAFCCISTGVFGFPADRAAGIAVKTVSDWLAACGDTAVEKVIFNVFSDKDKAIYERLLYA